MAGIKETTELLDFAVKLGNAIGKSLEDGNIGLSDATNFFGAVMAVPEAFGGIDQVPAELADLDEAELASLKQHLVEEFDIPQDATEAVVEKALGIATEVFSLIKLIQGPKPATV